MNHEILQLQNGRGYGFLHRADQPQPARVTVVMLNAGLIPRVGPARMNIELAERLSPLGFDLFRFDLPSIGDAPAGGGGQPVDRVREALDAVQSATGCSRFIIGGVCSAADLAWKLPERDPRIEGLILLDPYAIRGGWFRWAQLRRLLSRPIGDWPGMIHRRLGKQAATAQATGRDWPTQRDFVRRNINMMSNGIAMFVLYTSGIGHYFLHQRQLDGSFPGHDRHPRMRMRFINDIDHIMFVPQQRRAILDDIADWLHGLSPRPAGR